MIGGKVLEKGEFPADTGIVLDNIGFIRDKSGYDNLKILASILKKADDARIREVMEYVGLRAEDRTVYGKYSLGMKQKLLIAQAVMERPSLLLLEEPFNALDEESEERIIELLLRMNQEDHVTIVIDSHDREVLERLCDRIYRAENKNLLCREKDSAD